MKIAIVLRAIPFVAASSLTVLWHAQSVQLPGGLLSELWRELLGFHLVRYSKCQHTSRRRCENSRNVYVHRLI